MTSLAIGPGLAKVRLVRLVRTRTLPLVQLARGPLLAAVAAADVVSEGSIDGERYFGTTDILLRVAEGERELVAAMAGRDPHLRVHAVRVARREACSRVPGTLGTVHAELVVTIDGGGVRLHVDLEAGVVLARAALE